jgi:hypothetical protein
MADPTNNRAPRPATPLIQHNTLDRQGEGTVRWIVAAFLSIFLNGGVLGLLAVALPAPAGPPQGSAEQTDATQAANVQPAEPPPPEASDPLTVTDIDPSAIAPDLEINYNVERKADVSVPGIVNPDEPVGIENGDKSAPPMSIPLPFGTGGGTGAAMVSDVVGSGPSIGSMGGYSLRGAPLAGSFFGRSGATKKKALEEGGGTKESEATVGAGLTWLRRVQSPDGRWMLDGNFKNKGQANDIAGTAFGLLPFLGAGYTHKSKGKQNPYDKPIERALLFLMRRQDRKTGNLGGGMYGHCLATIALSEAYGLTQDPILRRPTQMAVNYIVAAQHSEGGWRYSPGERGDTSVTGWPDCPGSDFPQGHPLPGRRVRPRQRGLRLHRAGFVSHHVGGRSALPAVSPGLGTEQSAAAQGNQNEPQDDDASCAAGQADGHVLLLLRHAGDAPLRRRRVEGLE